MMFWFEDFLDEDKDLKDYLSDFYFYSQELNSSSISISSSSDYKEDSYSSSIFICDIEEPKLS